ncbi:hypothetical protein MNBD_GAMMA26-2613 [hydrothermal vent metagenome]|uniref:Outer membrane lipoprotein carrier protein LolA n=1 Tax=hydrothermal vent metagenome TaxID=652676 RepID=A0A3B1AW53_9ZZZZ
METDWLIKSFSSKCALCLILLVAPLQGYAAKCFVDSPSIVKGQIDFDAVKIRALTHAEKKSVQAILKKLNGEWQGSATGYFCFGKKQKWSTKPDNYTIKATAKGRSSRSVSLSAKLHSAEKKSYHMETLKLFLKGLQLYFDVPSSLGEISIISITPNNITFLQKYRNRVKSGGSIFREVVRSITVNESTLNIKHEVYTQGELSSESTWQLSKKL